MDRLGKALAAAALMAASLAPCSAGADVANYSYDALGRLSQACNARASDAEWTRYSLDPASNRTNYANTRVDLTLTADSGLYSANGRFVLWMQSDGNLVAYASSGGAWNPIWASNTPGSGASVAAFQSDGNLVLYDGSGSPVWASNSAPNYCSSLTVADDGNVTISSTVGAVVWTTNSGGH